MYYGKKFSYILHKYHSLRCFVQKESLFCSYSFRSHILDNFQITLVLFYLQSLHSKEGAGHVRAKGSKFLSGLMLLSIRKKDPCDSRWLWQPFGSPQNGHCNTHPLISVPAWETANVQPEASSILCFQGNLSFNSLDNDIIWLKWAFPIFWLPVEV